MRPSDLEAVAAAMEMEAGTMRREISAGPISDDEKAEGIAAVVEPRERAAKALREAATAMRRIPTMTIGLAPAQEG